MPPAAPTIRIRRLGRRGYAGVFGEMREYTDSRGEGSGDEVWLVEHSPVYTLGQTGRRDHVHAPGTIPVVATDRGGHVTYHGPGQIVVYVLFDLRRLGLGAARLVNRLEQSVIDVLADAGCTGARRPRAPGVYVDGRKIAAVGLRVRRGCTYHGVAVNVDVDLAPFRGIDPCGYPDLAVTRTCDLGIGWTAAETGERLARAIVRGVGAASPGVSGEPARSPGRTGRDGGSRGGRRIDRSGRRFLAFDPPGGVDRMSEPGRAESIADPNRGARGIMIGEERPGRPRTGGAA